MCSSVVFVARSGAAAKASPVMFVHPCSSYDVAAIGRLHDLFSGPLGVLTVACIGMGGLIAGARLVARGRVDGTRATMLVAIAALAVGGLITWGTTRFGATAAECRGEGDGGWGGRQLTWKIARRGIPAFVVSTSVEGDSRQRDTSARSLPSPMSCSGLGLPRASRRGA